LSLELFRLKLSIGLIIRIVNKLTQVDCLPFSLQNLKISCEFPSPKQAYYNPKVENKQAYCISIGRLYIPRLFHEGIELTRDDGNRH
uniref:Uncharacterized protein n=1 Tax=Crocodylus porosus TaxID=8502 RepID=A0A7M4FI90_CROPO